MNLYQFGMHTIKAIPRIAVALVGLCDTLSWYVSKLFIHLAAML